MRVAAWNVEGRLASYLHEETGKGTSDHILQGIEALDADVIALPEAYNGTAADKKVDVRMRQLNYDWFDTPYDDPNREEEIAMYGKANIRLASRLGFVVKKVVRFGGERNLLVGVVEDNRTGEQVQYIATHLEDRSEAQRQQQLDDIIAYVTETGMPTVMLGDFNAMWPGIRATLIGSFATRMVTKLLPDGDLKSELSRLIEMATSTAMQRLRDEALLQEADSHHRATVTPRKRNLPHLPATRLCQLDHILISPEIEVVDFNVAKDGGSDHRAISAMVHIKKEQE